MQEVLAKEIEKDLVDFSIEKQIEIADEKVNIKLKN